MSLRVLFGGSIAATMALAMGLWFLSWQVGNEAEHIAEASASAQRVGREVADLLVLTNEIAAHGEERAHLQWRGHLQNILKALEAPPVESVAVAVDLTVQAGRLAEFMARLESINAKPETRLSRMQIDLLLDNLLTETQTLSDATYRWAETLDATRNELRHRLQTIAILVPGLLLGSLVLLSFAILRRVITPLGRLNNSMAAVAKGDLTVRSAITTNDEIGHVSQAFDALAIDLVTRLRESERKLKESHDHLEHVVAERTSELRESKYRTQLILDSSADGIIGLDDNGFITMCNPSALAMLGYHLDELLGRNVHEAIHYEYADGRNYPVEECGVVEAIRAGCPIRVERDTFWCADGKPIPVSVATHPIMENGRSVGGVMNFQNISDRIKAEEAREEARISAEKLAQTKSEFLANMSHEIRTPLNGVLGMAQIGLRESAGRGKAQEAFNHILDSGKQLLSIINDILDFSKIEAGKLHVESIVFDPQSVVDSAVNGVSSLAKAKGIRLSSEKSELPAGCRGDPMRISQILLNLLSNAIKFTERGEVVLSASADHDYLIFSVRDSGIGISADTLSRLFAPFEQADSSTTRKYGGTGLGLVICRRLAHLMAGDLSVASTAGVGSTFTLRVPLVEAEELASAEPSDAKADQRLAGLRLLVAEDIEVNQLIMENFLSSEGANAVIVGNGILALKAIKEATTPFDAVLMDVQMPEMDGLQATRILRAEHPSLPIIGQSAHVLREEQEKCIAAGMVATISKPIDIEKLVATVRAHVAGAQVPMPASLPVPEAPLVQVLGTIDWQALRQQYSSKNEMIGRLCKAFLDGHGNDPSALRDAAAKLGYEDIQRIAHKLKSSCGYLKAESVSELASRVMRMASSQALDTSIEADRLADLIDAMLNEINQWNAQAGIP